MDLKTLAYSLAIASSVWLILGLVKISLINRKLHLVLFAVSGLAYAVYMSMSLYTEFYAITSTNQMYLYVQDWFRISGVTAGLCGIGVMVRHSKPKITRAPIVLSFLPVLLLIAHPFVMHTIILKEMLFNLYHGGGLLIALMMFGLKISKNRDFSFVFTGIVLLVSAFLMNFFDNIEGWLINICIALALLLIRTGYVRAEASHTNS